MRHETINDITQRLNSKLWLYDIEIQRFLASLNSNNNANLQMDKPVPKDIEKYFDIIDSFNITKKLSKDDIEYIEDCFDDGAGDGLWIERDRIGKYIDSLACSSEGIGKQFNEQFRKIQIRDEKILNFLKKFIKIMPRSEAYLDKWIIFKRKIDEVLKITEG